MTIETVKISDVPIFLELAVAADLPVLLRSKHGVGKSTIIEKVAEDLGIDCCVLDLSLMDAVDLTGLPYQEDSRTFYAPPRFLPKAGRGIFLLEEPNRASSQTRAPALELLTRRRLNDYVLPAGWLPCASINPEGEYDVNPLDPALLSRFMVLDVVPDHQGWLVWAKDNSIHSVIVSFVEESPKIFELADVNPRSLEYASNFLKSFEKAGHKNLSILVKGWAGLVGSKIAVALVRFYQGILVAPNPDEILGNYQSVRPAFRKMLSENKLDLIVSAVEKLKRHLQRQQDWDETAASKSRSGNLKQFLGDIPADMKAGFEAWLVQRGYRFGGVH